MPDVKNRSPLIANARINRQNMSLGEVAVWAHSRGRGLGVRFRRQHPIGPYILDFACLGLKLIVEIDGSMTPSLPIRSAISTSEIEDGPSSGSPPTMH